MQARFEFVPREESCAYCHGRVSISPLPTPIDAIYCISLQEQPRRTQQAIEQFHRVGLCRQVTLYRPTRGKNSERAIWDSHRALASHALKNGYRCALIFEDDADLRRPWPQLAAEIGQVISRLPADWYGLYLGHVPVQAYFVRSNVMRVRSLCTHAYIAGPRLLTWLAETDSLSPEAPMWQWVGQSIDSAMANLPGMYALLPMAAYQKFLGDYRVDHRVDAQGHRRAWRDIDRWRYYFIFHGAALAQALAVLLSPYHRFTLEAFRKRSETSVIELARRVRTSGLFDSAFYLRQRPDVAAQELNPLGHYLRYGAKEGTWPCPLFDPLYYAAQSPAIGDENPLAHFLRVGAWSGRKPHPLFDTDFYLARHAAKIPQGLNPLVHFIRDGAMSGCDPHPLFDCEWYLSQYPQLRERRENPLVHYLTIGWREAASPHRQFIGDNYLRYIPEAKATGVSPLEHLVRNGRAQERPQPSALWHAETK